MAAVAATSTLFSTSFLPIPTSKQTTASSLSLPFSSKPISLFSANSNILAPMGVVVVGPRKVSLSSDYDTETGQKAQFSEELKLFVGNLPFSADSAVLAGLFEQAGNVEICEVIYDKLTGRSRGFGFVTMSSIEEVETAEQMFNGYELDGRPLRVNSGPPPPRDEDAPRSFRTGGGGGAGAGGFGRGGGGGGGFGGGVDSAHRVHVGNLSWGVDDSVLENLFSEQGKVLNAKVIYDRETGRSKGFGFVSYGSEEEIENATNNLDGVELDGREIRVTVAEARPPRRQF